MREIKFRGKRLDNGEWRHGDLLTEYIHHEGLTIVENGCIYYEVNPDTLGQFTGLKDRNGAEIYEGDIVRWINSDDESVHSVVEFVDGAFRVHNVCFTLWDYLDNDAEVIGNIHDKEEQP